MASPQLENGHTRIANDLLDAIVSVRFSCVDSLRVLFWIVRNSYGWNRKETNPTGVRELGRLLKIPSQTISRALKELISTKIIKSVKGGWAINKDFDGWTVPPAGHPKVYHLRGKSVPPAGHPVPPTGHLLGERQTDKDKKDKAARMPKIRHPAEDCRFVVDTYLKASGKGGSDLARDPGGWGRWMVEADKLLGELGGRVDLAQECIEDRSKDWSGVADWSLSGVTRRSKDWLANKQAGVR